MTSSTFLGHPALRLLIRMKLRGALRSQLRKLHRPSGWLFALLGLSLFGLWIGRFVLLSFAGPQPDHDPEALMLWTKIGLTVVCLMTVLAAFSHRGLYLPKEEIELAFSGPLSRSDLIRYRLGVNVLRSIFAGALFGLGAARSMPVGLYGFLGVVVAMLTVPMLGQATALLLGDTENRLGRLAKVLPLRAIAGILGALVGVSMLALIFASDDYLGETLGRISPLRVTFDTLAESSLLRSLLLPLEPWARMIAAPDALTFLLWLVACGGLWIVGWELTARIPVDFRETSLATSADVARRLSKLRGGGSGGLAGTMMSKPRTGWNVPWALGRGPFGAIAWLKLATILRKARGAFLFSAAIVLFVTVAMTVAWRGDTVGHVLGGSAALAIFGTIYLCSGLRFDFRNDLDQMEQIKAWPVPPAKVFLATVLPQVLLVSGMLAGGILLRCVAIGSFHPGVIGILAFQPLVALAWTAVDNAVFLFSPVRYAPGQEGALQHIGRSVVMTLLRIGLLGVSLTVAVLPGVLTAIFADKVLGAGDAAAATLGAAVGWIGLLAIDGALVFAGGKLLRRFDLARDRG
jgi:hypothetical protein